MKAWLHIGTPKTGTTTLQKFLDTNHAALLAQRVLCANTTGELALACTENYDSEGLSRVYGIRKNIEWIQFKQTVIRELKEKVKSHRTIADYIVFSSEYFHLSLTKPSELEALKNLLHNVGITEISVVVYLREQSEFVASFYSTVIKSGGTSERPPGVSNKRYQRLCDHRLTLELFSIANLSIVLIRLRFCGFEFIFDLPMPICHLRYSPLPVDRLIRSRRRSATRRL